MFRDNFRISGYIYTEYSSCTLKMLEFHLKSSKPLCTEMGHVYTAQTNGLIAVKISLSVELRLCTAFLEGGFTSVKRRH
jgi:hypothetical protein